MVNNRDETFLEFEKQYQISAENLSFKDFLLTISRDEPASLDRHWRPLSDLLAVRLFSYDHIGKIENIGDLKDDLLQRFFPVVAAFESGQSHSTNSSNKVLQYYTADEIDLVNAIYEEDFINFRYVMDDLENLNGEPVDVRQLDERAVGNLYEVLCGRTPADIAKNAYDAGILHAQADLVLKSGEAFMDLGLLDQSEDAVEKAIGLGTKRSSAYRTLAVIERRKGCYETALDYGRKAIDIRPSFVGNYICVANIYKESQRYEEALDVLLQGLESCSVDRWRLEEGIRELPRFIKQKPS